MAYNLKFLQTLSAYQLAGAGATVGDTSIVLKSFKDIDGNAITMTEFGTIGYATLEPGSANLEEQISFTGITNNANGSSTITGVSNVAFYYPYTATSGLVKTHAGSTNFVISNTSAFYQTIIDYINGIAIAGAPDASTLVKGISKMSVAPASATSPIAVGDNDPRVPTADPTTLFAPHAFFPVGSIYMSVVSTNPATLFGFGTWTAWGTGRVPVAIDTGDPDFNTVEKTGGEKTHTLITAELAAHTHTTVAPTSTQNNGGTNDGSLACATTSQSPTHYENTDLAGSGTAHNNLQPYITCYMWKRTA